MSLAIRSLRQQKGWTQLELAQRAGLDRVATISELENGRGNPTLQTLNQIAEALGVTLRDLFEIDQAEAELDEILAGLKRLDKNDRETVRDLLLRLART